jgi:hypothetical protein
MPMSCGSGVRDLYEIPQETSCCSDDQLSIETPREETNVRNIHASVLLQRAHLAGRPNRIRKPMHGSTQYESAVFRR